MYNEKDYKELKQHIIYILSLVPAGDKLQFCQDLLVDIRKLIEIDITKQTAPFPFLAGNWNPPPSGRDIKMIETL